MNILSLFDGKSGGQIALDRLKIKYNTYYASEINPHSIKITQKNYPNTVQLGDVRNIDFHKFKHIDLLLGGTPCTDLSIVAVDRKDITKGLQGTSSSLFYEYVKALNIISPKYFLVENVVTWALLKKPEGIDIPFLKDLSSRLNVYIDGYIDITSRSIWALLDTSDMFRYDEEDDNKIVFRDKYKSKLKDIEDKLVYRLPRHLAKLYYDLDYGWVINIRS